MGLAAPDSWTAFRPLNALELSRPAEVGNASSILAHSDRPGRQQLSERPPGNLQRIDPVKMLRLHPCYEWAKDRHIHEVKGIDLIEWLGCP